MASVKETDFNTIKGEFYSKASNILAFKTDKRKTMTTDPDKIEKYRNELVEKYNAMAELAESIYESLKKSEQDKLVNSFTQYYRPRLAQALDFIGYVVEMPQRFGTIDIAKVQKLDEGAALGGTVDDDDFEWDGFEQMLQSQDQPNDSQLKKNDIMPAKTQGTGTKSRFFGMTSADFDEKFSFRPQNFNSNRGKGTNVYDGNRNNSQKRSNPNPNFNSNSHARTGTNFGMDLNADSNASSQEYEDVEQISEMNFYNLCARTFTETYAGDALALKPFISKINMVQRMCQHEGHEAILRDCIMAHVTGLAADVLPADPESIESIKKILLDKIKPESSKVVKGKLLALKADRNNLTEYAKKAEQLAVSLKRSLILEGIPFENANKMVVDDTIDLCRSNTNSILVKAALIAPNEFKDARDVLAKYITETRKNSEEQQILTFRQTNSNSNRKSGNNFQRRGGNNNNYGRNYYQSQGRNYRSNYRNGNYGRGNYYQNQSRGNGRGRGSNFRGRGNQQNNWSGERQNRSYYYAENERAPPSGAAQAQNVQSNQADR